MSRLFGWSYPPGCSGPPDYSDEICDICGSHIDDCICPECPVCGGQGDKNCYAVHGLIQSPEQIEGRKKAEERIQAALKAEAEYFSKHDENYEKRS